MPNPIAGNGRPEEAGFADARASESLPADRIDLWIVPLQVDQDRADTLWESLSPDERARAGRFAFDRDRRRFVVGRGAMRQILAGYLDSSPDSIRFAYGEHGKPMLAEPTKAGRLEFNASGSEELAVCAATVGRQVGVDIEWCRLPHDESVLETCFSPAERGVYRSLPDEQKAAAFYRLWTLKEAYLKATGAGLSRALLSFEIAFSPSQPARLSADSSDPNASGKWTLLEFQPGPRHAGALVLAGDARPLRTRHWTA